MVHTAKTLAATLAIAAAATGLLLGVPLADTSAQVFDESGQKIIRIGTILSQTDPGANHPHNDRFLAMTFARDDFNAAQRDYRLELVDLRLTGESDFHADNRTGAKIKEAFESQGITYFVGPMGSTDTTSAKAQLALLEPANPSQDFVVISPASTALSLRSVDSVFRMTIDDSRQAVVLADLLQSDGKTHAVMIGLNTHHEIDHGPERDIWSKGLEDAFTTSFAGKGTIAAHLTIAVYDSAEDAPAPAVYDVLASDLNREVSELVDQHGADSVAVVMMAYSADLSHLVEAIQRNPSLGSLDDVNWYGPDGIASRDDLVGRDNLAVGSFLAGVQLKATQYAGEANPTRADVLSRLQNGGVSSTGSIYLYSSYDAVGLLANAIAERDRDGNTEPIKDLLHRLADDPTIGTGALGDYSFNVNGDLDEPLSYKVWRIVLQSNFVPAWTDAAPPARMVCR